MAVAVPGLTHVAVPGPRRDLLPVESGRDEVGDRAVPCLVWRDRLEAGGLPCLVRPGAGRGREERLCLRPTEDEVLAVAVGALLECFQFSADDECHRARTTAGAGLDIDRTLDRIPR